MPRANGPKKRKAAPRPVSRERTVSAPRAPVEPARRKRYHHGRLREALIEATIQLLEEGGPERVTVREAGKRAGVSSGAPFRHFPTRTALLTAVAEQAMGRFRVEIDRALEQAGPDDPLARFRAVGTAYLRWALGNPMHFRIISDRSLVDLDGSETFRRHNAEIQGLMDELLADARHRDLLRPVDMTLVPLAARALVYGLARMYVDGHLAQWGVAPGEAERRLHGALDLIIDSLSTRPTGSASVDEPTGRTP
jgi:AcrR family transcriptional regulator